MSIAAIWFIVAAVLFILEILTPGTFFFACLGLGAVCAGISALLFPGEVVSAVAFIVFSVASIYTIRPFAKKMFKFRDRKSNTDALVGKKTTVLENITPTEMGLVKIDGEFWKAASDEKIEVGAIVEVINIEGTHLIVKKVEGRW